MEHRVFKCLSGYFHILGGTISSNNQKKEDLLIDALSRKSKKIKLKK